MGDSAPEAVVEVAVRIFRGMVLTEERIDPVEAQEDHIQVPH
jgi:hypothetical protein